MRKILTIIISILLLVLFPFSQLLFAQNEKETLSNIIRQKDSLFWKAYNSCDTAEYQKYISNDVEFYHDKGGITLGLEKLLDITKKNLCGTNNFRLRREAVPGTVKVFPMESNGTIYGAIFSGEHVFYIREGEKETLDGLAKFTHLWILKDGDWKMSRILSYDHGPAVKPNQKKQIAVSDKILYRYIGDYEGPKTGLMNISKNNGTLTLSVQDKKYTLFPEADNRFFVKDRDLTFEFISNQQSKISKIVVRENGEIVEEAGLKK